MTFLPLFLCLDFPFEGLRSLPLVEELDAIGEEGVTICEGDHWEISSSQFELLESLPCIKVGGIGMIILFSKLVRIFSRFARVFIWLLLTIVAGIVVKGFVLLRVVALRAPFISLIVDTLIGPSGVGWPGVVIILIGCIASTFIKNFHMVRPESLI